MIELTNMTKSFNSTVALKQINLTLQEGYVYGLAGSNGAGKTTLLRLLAGVDLPSEGTVQINGASPYENEALRGRCIFIPDIPHYFEGSTLESMAQYYAGIYSRWDPAYYSMCLAAFDLNPKTKLSRLSKGKLHLAALTLGLSASPDYLFLDEVFDGLDPVVRKAVKTLLIQLVSEKNLTILISSHNLRDIDELCDHLCLLHNGNLVFSEDTDELKQHHLQVEAAFETDEDFEFIQQNLKLSHLKSRGRIHTFLLQGDLDKSIQMIRDRHPLVYEALPLTLEEIVIYHMEEMGYEVNL